jgi:proline iminopeptidase
MVYLHGGPGSGCSPRHRQFFDPEGCRAVLFDQRGCGRSLPRGALQHNTTDALVQDMEALRQHLGIARWLVVGGSWGAGLALAYANANPEACLGLVLRGVFLGRAADVDWFFDGVAQLLPDAWQQLEARVAQAEQAVGPAGTGAAQDVLRRLHGGLHEGNFSRALACATAWEAWEHSVSSHRAVAPRTLAQDGPEAARLADTYRLQSHYLLHHCFRDAGGLLPRAGTLAGLPVAILHGRLDWVCLPQAAWELHRSLLGSHLQWIEGCGHSPFEPAMAQALVSALQHFVQHAGFAHWGASSPATAPQREPLSVSLLP